MICPLYLLAQSNPEDPYLILNTHTISFGEMHLQVMSCEHILSSYPTQRPIAIDSSDIYALMSWILAPLERVIGSRSHPVKIPP